MPGERPRHDLYVALSAAIIAALFGLAFVVPVPFWAGQPTLAPAPPGSPAPAAPPEVPWPAGLALAAGFALVLCLPYRPYALAQRALAGRTPSLRLLLGLTAGLAAVALLIYPRFGTDAFEYIVYARLFAVYGDNPLTAQPRLHPDDWSYAFAWYRDRPTAYGPLWSLITWPIARLAGDSLAGYLLGFKALAFAAYAGTSALVWHLASPTQRARALVSFAWSPLVLFEVLGKVHNDVLLALGCLLALWAARRAAADGLLLAATVALVKATGAVVWPVLARQQVRNHQWRQLAAGFALSVAVVALAYAPFWSGVATFAPLLQQTGRVVWSPGTLLLALLQPLAGPAAEPLSRGLLGVAWVLAVCLVLWRTPAPTSRQAAQAAALLLVATLAGLTTAVFAHYLVPLVALAAVAQHRLLDRLTTAASLGSLAAYAVPLLGVSAGPAWGDTFAYAVLGSLLTVLPPALVLLLPRPKSAAPETLH